MIYRCIAPEWLTDVPKVIEGELSDAELKRLNSDGYNIYFLPNYPSIYIPGTTVSGTHIDTFRYVFIDCDLKDKVYGSKEEFLSVLNAHPLIPSFVVDSGNGIHAYYLVSDLDAKSFLRLQRRLCRLFKTDEAVSKIYQLMRLPGTINQKNKDTPKNCEILDTSDVLYTCEQIDKLLPIISDADEAYCAQHYNKTYQIIDESAKVNEEIPPKFGDLLRQSKEAKEIWLGNTDDRSKGDYRLGHIMQAAGFTKEEAVSVLMNSSKAITRAPIHRVNYATDIINKIWMFEEAPQYSGLSISVKDILSKPIETLKGTRFPCWKYFDDTEHGFRLGQVIGLVAGSGVGKTAIALNMFRGFVQSNPDYIHMFIPLEQPAHEIAERWGSMCADSPHLHEKVHVMSNYGPNGEFRHLSLHEIKEYILKFQKETQKKIGCVVIDHIGALKKKGGKNGENQDLMDICHSMKAFAIETNTLLIMQSQAPREKAGIGDLELDKNAAYGTVFFESYVDYLITLWQPLKRCYAEGAPTISAFKFCKIRHKKQGYDNIKEDVCYKMMFDPQDGKLRELTEDEEKSFKFFLNKATNKRKQDKQADLVEYVSVAKESSNGAISHNRNPSVA